MFAWMLAGLAVCDESPAGVPDMFWIAWTIALTFVRIF